MKKNVIFGALLVLSAGSLAGCQGLAIHTDRTEYNDAGQITAHVVADIESRRQYAEFYLDYEKDRGVQVRASEVATSADPTAEKLIEQLTEVLAIYGGILNGRAIMDAAGQAAGIGVLLNQGRKD